MNVEVRRIDMVRATGRVIFPDGPFPSRESFSVAGIPDECNPGPTRPGTIRPNMTFDFFAWPGQVHVSATTRELAPRTLRMTVTHNGADVTRNGIEFVQGREVSGIVIQMHSPAVPPASPR